MLNEEEKLKRFIAKNRVKAEHLRFEKSLHSVQDCLRVSGISLDEIVKTMIFIGPHGETIAAIVPARYRVSTSRLEKATGLQGLRLASQAETYEKTGYPAGGTPCFGYGALWVADPTVLERKEAYTGGGSEFSIARVQTEEIRQKPGLVVCRIRGEKSN